MVTSCLGSKRKYWEDVKYFKLSFPPEINVLRLLNYGKIKRTVCSCVFVRIEEPKLEKSLVA